MAGHSGGSAFGLALGRPADGESPLWRIAADSREGIKPHGAMMEKTHDHAVHERKVGIAYGLGAYCWWGILPLWVRALAHVNVLEILAHRIVWSFVMLAVIQAIRGRWGIFFAALRQRRTLLLMLGATVTITINWLVFLYAIHEGKLLQASMGYFVNPLVSVLLGFLFLKERLRAMQKVALALAAAGVAMLTLGTGTVPGIALVLALTFGLYGLFRKLAPVEAMSGVGFETALVTPMMLVAMGWLFQREGLQIVSGTAATQGLLLLGGIITATPLIFFSNAARRLPLATIGFMQYITPTLQFLTAVLLFGEAFTTTHLMSFAAIWTGLLVYTTDLLSRPR